MGRWNPPPWGPISQRAKASGPSAPAVDGPLGGARFPLGRAFWVSARSLFQPTILPFGVCGRPRALPSKLGRALFAGGPHDSYLVDSASSHMLVSKIKPCMSKYKQLYCETANGSLNQLSFI